MFEKIKDYLRHNDSTLSEWLFCRYYEKREKRNASLCGFVLNKECGEDEYIKKWSKILRFPTLSAYRFYAKFTGATPDIVSQTAANKINEFLNPSRYIGYLSDKNCFDKILPSAPFPRTIIRKIRGDLYNNLYEPLSWDSFTNDELYNMLVSYNRIVVKDTLDSDSGRGINVFCAKDDIFVNVKNEKEVLNIDWLKNKSNDFIVQEALTQNDFMSRLNPTSINTIRIAVYRSVVDNEPHILSTVIRMGVKNSVIDNLHGGGRMIRVYDDGQLAKFCMDQYGRKYNSHNDIDFGEETMVLPQYGEIKELVKTLSKDLINARLMQWDVAIDCDNKLRVLEFNLTGFSMWIAQMTGTPAYGEYTDEIIDYVAKEMK